MSEGANREELDRYARPTPPPPPPPHPSPEDILSITTCEGFRVHHFYVVCLSQSANFSVVF